MGAPIQKERTASTPKADVRQLDGKTVRSIDLDPQLFGHTPNIPLMHQVVNAQLAARRAGTQSTKTRAEVAGGGAKPWRQKGTGRARAGSNRSPIFVGGGVALGPKPRSYEQRTPKKMVRLALLSALSDRAAEGRIIVASDLAFDTPKTKDALAALKAWGAEGPVLIVLGDEDENVYLAFRNVPKVHVVHVEELNTYDVLRSDYVVFTEGTLPTTQDDDDEAEAPAAPAAKAKPAKPAAAKAEKVEKSEKAETTEAEGDEA
jgi:large subunit ribosomal protein L4